MLTPRMKVLPKNWSRRQRHIMLNKALNYTPTNPVFTHINQKGVVDSLLVLKYKDEFLKQIYGKAPYDPTVLVDMLPKVEEEMHLHQLALKQVLNEGGDDG